MEISYIFLILFIFNLFIFKFNNLIAKKFSLYDKPDYKRKIHKEKVPLTGGIFLFLNFIFILILLKINYFDFLNLYISNKRELFAIFFLVTFLFLLGLYDDRYNISASTKLSFINIYNIYRILIDENIIINQLVFNFYPNVINLSKLSIPLTILFILLFINALNMFDGIDMQVSGYFLILIIFLLIKFNIMFLIYFIPVILFNCALNFKKKLFLGDSGTNIISILIAWVIIKNYNLNNSFTCEEIFIIMAIPGLDMFRLFCSRVLNGKNPFVADKNHLHHYFLSRFDYFPSFFLIQLMIILPLAYYFIKSTDIITPFIMTIFIYLISIIILKNKNK